VLPIIDELAAQVGPKHNITIRHMDIKNLEQEIRGFVDVYNAAWKRNWGFVPYSDEDLKHYAEELQLVFDKHWFFIAEKEDTGEVVGMAITVPDLNQVLERMRGRILPFGWWHFLIKGRIMDRVRVGFLGVKPEYQHTGVAAMMYVEHFNVAERTHRKWGEMGWILETNRAMNRGMAAMNGRVVKRYRIYERAL
jgi:GNAT superfamily N-acetyltransferase